MLASGSSVAKAGVALMAGAEVGLPAPPPRATLAPAGRLATASIAWRFCAGAAAVATAVAPQPMDGGYPCGTGISGRGSSCGRRAGACSTPDALAGGRLRAPAGCPTGGGPGGLVSTAGWIVVVADAASTRGRSAPGSCIVILGVDKVPTAAPCQLFASLFLSAPTLPRNIAPFSPPQDLHQRRLRSTAMP